MSALLQLQSRIQARLARPDSDRGAALLEYALLVSLIAIVCLVAIVFLGDETSSHLTETGSSVSNAN